MCVWGGFSFIGSFFPVSVGERGQGEVCHIYMYPQPPPLPSLPRLDDTIRAAREIGLRFHAVRGGMSAGVSKGGIPPDHVVREGGAGWRGGRGGWRGRGRWP